MSNNMKRGKHFYKCQNHGEAMNRDKIHELLRAKGSEKLYWHAQRVENTAIELAQKYGLNQEKAALAGLTHDYGKLLGHDELIGLVLKNSISIEPIMLWEPALLHAPVGAWLLEHELGLQEQDVLDAVRQHTTGSEKMGLLSRVVYLADFIEPGRKFSGVEKVRDLALKQNQLEQALLVAVEMTIFSVLQKGRLLHGASIAMRNSIILFLREKKLEEKHGKG